MNLHDLLETTARENPQAEAVSCGGVRLSYAGFVARVRRRGKVFLAAGLERGDRVAILSPNCHALLEVWSLQTEA
jgi:acyl-CoA synthetase (AMP-forming)/AMP-acid ligase II